MKNQTQNTNTYHQLKKQAFSHALLCVVSRHNHGARMLHDHQCQQATKQWFTDEGQQPTLTTCFLGGAAAGAGFWGVWYPLETIKTRMQVSRPACPFGWPERFKTEEGEGYT